MNLNIRKAENTKKDCSLIFELANDDIVRANSFSTDKILWENHCVWYEKALSDNNLLFFLVFSDDSFVGQIRFKRNSSDSSECIVSLSITEEFRGKGLSSDFLQLGIEELKKIWSDVYSVIAEVKVSNAASNKLFNR